ncbi:GNAT family N-acetyltransferase [Nocardioides plantarum]|uniref:GNAT family N-acetyltransferase n=1 Tax=Nocardioides plantarum TaxID=29299 RepID=A0ABV5K8X0_9ACTN|nr:GNAT family N-acetyltransferase [Nocardioides plantarum]
MPSTALALPDVRLAASWAATLRDFGTTYPHGSGVDPDSPPVLDEAGCAAFVADLLTYADPAARLPDGRVSCTYFWVLDGDSDDEDDEMVGFLAVRHRLNDFLLEQGGHIGYSVRPSARRRGHATSALRLGLAHAAALGLDRVLLTCDLDNAASRRTIQRAGGRLEDVRAGKQRFWLETARAVGVRVSPGVRQGG